MQRHSLLTTLYKAPSGSVSPLPTFSNVVGVWSLWNWNPVGYPAGVAFSDANDNDASFTEVAPYPVDYAAYTGGPAGDPPYLLKNWNDQNGNVNTLVQGNSAAQPTLDATNKWVAFNGTSTGLQGGNLFSSAPPTGTIYVAFKAGSLIETSVLLETGTTQLGAGNISIRLVAGVLTCSITNSTGLLLNSKIKTISDSNWHWLAMTWDQGAAAASQVLLKVDNSATGVTAPVSTDLAAAEIGRAAVNVGARNNAASAFFTGNMRHIYCENAVDDATRQTAMYSYFVYLQTLAP